MFSAAFIFWGKRRTTKRLGYVAEFCAFCRGIRAHSVTACFVVDHFYMIPIGRRTETKQVLRCTGCGRKVALDAGAYAAGARRSVGDIEALIDETNPNVRHNWADRLALEERARQSPDSLSAEERAWLVAEPFRELADDVEKWSGKGKQVDVPGAVCLAAAFALGMVSLTSGSFNDAADNRMPLGGAICGVLAAILLVVGVYLVVTGPRRFLRRRILPLLGRSLAPLKPSRDEIESALRTMAESGWAIGTRLAVSEVVAAVRVGEAARVRGGAGVEDVRARGLS